MPGIIRKPLLIVGLMSFVVALLISRMQYFVIYMLTVGMGLLYYFVSWSVMLSFSSYVFPMLVSLEFLVCTWMILDGKLNLPDKIVWLFFIATFVTALTTICGLFKFPMAVRVLGQASSDDNSPMQFMFRRYNMAGWGLLFGMGFMEGSLIYTYKKQKNIFLLIIIISDGICVLMSQLVFAVILSGIVFTLVLMNGSNRKFVLRSIFLFLTALIAWIERSAILTFFYELAVKSNLTMIQLRIKNLMDLLIWGNTSGDAGARFELYMRGIRSFLLHPFGLFFTRREEIENLLGFHSEFFDLIGSMGILGVTSAIILVLAFVSRTKKIDEPYNRRFIIFMAGTFGIMFLINPVLYHPHIILSTLLIPGILAKSNT